jgi:S-disulfanyl-L-cysteine oxidoreductase SoxD
MATGRRRLGLAVTIVWIVIVSSAGLWSARPGSASLSGKRRMPAQTPTYGLGRPPSPDEIKAIDIDVTPDGKGLPPGRGTAAVGKDVYTRRCETCHGPTGTEGPQEVLAGGQGSLTTARPQKTVGSYWPYATTLWDYVYRAMPFDHPGTMTADDVYAATAYVLFLNGIVKEHDVLDQTTLPQVKMPNRAGFVIDPRPDIGGKPTSDPRPPTPKTQRKKGPQ